MIRLTLAAIGILGTCLLLGVGDPPAKETGPLVELSGSYSHVDNTRVEVVGDSARWEQVWKEHVGDKLEKTSHGMDVIPAVDFSRCMVVAMFSGKTVNTAGWHVISTQERDGHILIRYDEFRFQSESSDGKDPGFDSTGYGFAVVERSPLPIILEENNQSLIDGGPVWKERQRLPALPKPVKRQTSGQ